MNNKTLLFPIKYTLLFLIISEILIWFGPIDYGITNPYLLIFYLGILNYSLYLGFVRGTIKSRYTIFRFSDFTVKFLLLFGLLCTIYTMYVKWMSHGHSVTFETLVSALSDPGSAYSKKVDNAIDVSFVYALVSPLQWAAIPLGIYYWKQLSPFFKIVVISTCFIYIITWLGIGTRKGVFDFILIGSFLLVASNPNILSDKARLRKLKVIAFCTLAVFLVFFIFSNISRGGGNFSDFLELEKFDFNSIYTAYLPIGVVVALAEITNYLCGGYPLLSIGLQLGINTPTLFGMSFGTAQYSARFLGYDPMPHTYIQILHDQFAYDKYEYWHTIYLWLANDFTFIGVPIVVFCIGYYFARVWRDALYGKNPLAYPVLAYMLIMVFYFFANNQVLSFSLESFVGCVAWYEISRLRVL